MKVLKIGLQKSKIRGFLFLSFHYQFIVVSYLFKKNIGLEPSREEIEFYRYFNYLVRFRGRLIERTSKAFIGNFGDLSDNQIKIRRDPSSDLDVFQQIFFWSEYLPVVKSYKNHFKFPGGKVLNIIDAGGNIGLTSLFFLKIFKNCNIICLEPDIGNYEVLNYNLPKNKNVSLLNAALWSSNSKVEIINDFRDRLDWARRVKEINHEKGIPAFSVNQLMKDFNWSVIDILKIDIEGAEKEVFTSKDADLSFLQFTKCIAMEIHDEFNCRSEINKILEQFGFEYFRCGELTIALNKSLK
ncbi:FkbM family methyltransferase [Gramella sp. Hel_I_59]|uniref:FkbM family methyltransferase n=1 Tax=Gramella sp. Hel_I_59 TaxID=1249978 RepID=UPI001150DF2D|nr:FkbM family methyltransferase [Gramella sp. Hel_I_59]TQI71528.1 FkbM family methyltransferase [Gramella sp. Hel_I_59]